MENSPTERSHPEQTAASASWDEAFLRVESYLHAHHLESRMLLNQIATDIIQGAREQVDANSGKNQVAAAMSVTHARIGAWFAHAGMAGDWSDERVRAGNRLALVLADLPGQWANYFLSAEGVPPELSALLTSRVLQPGPELRFSNMPPAPLDFGVNDSLKAWSYKKNVALMLRAASVWLAIIGLYGVAWAAAH